MPELLWTANPKKMLNRYLNQESFGRTDSGKWIKLAHTICIFCYRGLDAIKILYQQNNIEYVVNVFYIAQPSAVATEDKATFYFLYYSRFHFCFIHALL